jgi:hypothetical protein
MKINKEEFRKYLLNVCEKQSYLWQAAIEQAPQLVGMNIDPKENICDVSIDVYADMIERTGKQSVSLIELGGGLPREAFYLAEKGLVSRIVSIDKSVQESGQLETLAEAVGLKGIVKSVKLDLETQRAETDPADIVVSRNFLYGAANSVVEYMLGETHYNVSNKKVLDNTLHLCNSILGVVRIITDGSGKLNRGKVKREMRCRDFEIVSDGSNPLKVFTGSPVMQVSYQGVKMALPMLLHEGSSVDYVIAKKQ